MSIRTFLSFAGAFAASWFLVVPVLGQDVENKKLEAAYQWSREQFNKETAQIEQDYEEAIRAAQTARAEAVKQARARFIQGLEFLNTNPALPQSMREQINEEMKRIAALPKPTIPAATKTEKSESGASKKANRKEVTIKIDAPDSGWSIQILQSKKVNDEIWVLSALEHGSGVSAMVVTPVNDSVVLEAPSDLAVRHFVLNKTWDSKDDPEGVKFISGVPDLGRDWVLGKLLQVSREPADK